MKTSIQLAKASPKNGEQDSTKENEKKPDKRTTRESINRIVIYIVIKLSKNNFHQPPPVTVTHSLILLNRYLRRLAHGWGWWCVTTHGTVSWIR